MGMSASKTRLRFQSGNGASFNRKREDRPSRAVLNAPAAEHPETSGNTIVNAAITVRPKLPVVYSEDYT